MSFIIFIDGTLLFFIIANVLIDNILLFFIADTLSFPVISSTFANGVLLFFVIGVLLFSISDALSSLITSYFLGFCYW